MHFLKNGFQVSKPVHSTFFAKINSLKLRSKWDYSGTNQNDWIRMYASVFLVIHKISSKTVIQYSHQKSFAIIYLLLFSLLATSTKVFSTTRTSHWTIRSSVKSMLGSHFVDKCLWLIHMICRTYYFSLFSMITTHLTSVLEFSNPGF